MSLFDPLLNLVGFNKNAPPPYLGQPGSVALAPVAAAAAALAAPVASSALTPIAAPRNFPVRLASTGQNVPLVSGTVTSLDGVALAINDRVLLKDQSNAIENGIYQVQQLVPTLTLLRPNDASSIAQLAGYDCVVQAGNSNAGKQFAIVADPNFAVVGSTAISVVQVGPAPGPAVAPTANSIGSPGLMTPVDKARTDSHGLHRARVCSTSNVALSGTSSATIDGIALQVNDRVLLVAQTNAPDNGLYMATQVSPSLTLIRAPEVSSIQAIAGASVLVEMGTSNGNTLWFVSGFDPDIASLAAPGGSGTSISFVQLQGTRPDPVTGLFMPQTVRITWAAGTTDVQVLPGSIPFGYRIIDFYIFLNTADSGKVAELFTLTGGGGTALSNTISLTTVGLVRMGTGATIGNLKAAGNGTACWFNLNNNLSVGEAYVVIQRT